MARRIEGAATITTVVHLCAVYNAAGGMAGKDRWLLVVDRASDNVCVLE